MTQLSEAEARPWIWIEQKQDVDGTSFKLVVEFDPDWQQWMVFNVGLPRQRFELDLDESQLHQGDMRGMRGACLRKALVRAGFET